MKPLNVDLFGPENASALVLVHGSVVTRAMWKPQIDAFANEYRIIAPDLPGHGALASVPFRMSAAVDTLHEAIARYAKGKVLLVGISLGGYVVSAFAQQHPEQVAGLVIASATLNPTGIMGFWLRIAGVITGRLFSEQRLIKSSAKSLRRKLPAELAEPIIKAGLYPRGGGQSFLEMAGRDFLAMARTFTVPVLYMNGANDRSFRRHEELFTANTPGARLKVIENGGHTCNLDQSDAFNAAVRAFALEIGLPQLTVTNS